jgi:ankyrin repeat protein
MQTSFVPKYNPRTITYNNPDRSPPGDTINKIFSRVASGRFFDIKKAIIEGRSSLGLIDITGKTILHHILLNNELNKTEKYDLIKQVLEFGSPVDIQDNAGVRPLHLAVGQQNGKVVKLLLEKKADANSRDNNHLSPLHYAVLPETTTCPNITKTFTGNNIIPDTDTIKSEIRTDKLFNSLFDYFKSDDTILMYISHIASIFKNRYVYNEEDDIEYKHNLIKLVSDTIKEHTDISSSESIESKLIALNKSIYTKTKTYLSRTLSKISIKENSKDGWAPQYDNIKDKNHAILPFPNLKYEFNSAIQIPFSTSSTIIINKTLAQINDTSSIIDKMKSDILKTYKTIDILSDCSYLLQIFGDTLEGDFGDTFEISDKMISTLNNILNDFLKMFYYEPHLETPIIFGTDFNHLDIADKHNMFEKINAFSEEKASYNNIGLGNIMIYYIDKLEAILKNTKDSASIICSNIQYNNNRYQTIDLFANIQANIIQMNYILVIFEKYSNSIAKNFKILKEKLEKTDLMGFAGNLIKLLNAIIDFYEKNKTTSQLVFAELTSIFPESWNKYYMIVKVNDSMFIYKDADQKYCLMKGSDITVLPITDDYYIINNNTNDKIRYIDKTKTLYFCADIIKYNSNIESDINMIIDNWKCDQMTNNDNITSLYSNIYKFQSDVNSLITIFNMLNGIIYTNGFNNMMVDNTYDNKSTENLALLYTNLLPLEKIPEVFNIFHISIQPLINIDKTTGKIEPDSLKNIVINLIDNYGYKVNNNNKIKLVEKLSSTLTPQSQTDGILLSDNFDPALSLVLQGTGIVKGNIEIITNNLKFNKADDVAEFSIIKSIYDEHLYLIKIIIIMYVVQLISNIIGNGKKNLLPDGSKEKELFLVIEQFRAEIEEINNNNVMGILFAIIGNMTHDIIVTTIDSISQINSSNYLKYLSKGLEVNSSPLSSLIGASDIKDIRQLITKPDENVRLKDSELLSSIVGSGSGSKDTDIVKFFNNMIDVDSSENDFNRLIDQDSLENNSDICYQIDENIIGYLLNAGTDPNMIERTGETALSYSVFLQNEQIVETLLRSRAKVILNNKNIYNVCFEQLLNSIRLSPIMNVEEINHSVDNHLKITLGDDKRFISSKLIISMTAYLFMHQLTIFTGSYPNMWTRDSHNKILNMINIDSNNKQNIIPLATMNASIISNTINGYATYNDMISTLSSKLTKAREVFIRLDNSRKNLEIELKELKPSDTYTIEEKKKMIDEIKNEIKNINQVIANILKEISDMEGIKTRKNDVTKINSTVKEIQESNKMFKSLNIMTSRNVCNVYNVFFKEIISNGLDVTNAEYTTYIRSWMSLITKTETAPKSDPTQMIKTLMLYISDQDIVKPKIFLDAYEPICELYNKVLGKYSRDYMELKPYLNKDGESSFDQNYVLKQIYCIMLHVFKHTMSINFINTIAQLLARRDRGRDKELIMRNVYRILSDSEFIKYCVEVVPRQIIKVTCKISSSESDPDASLSVTTILNNAIEKISLNNFDSVDSQTISFAKENLVPFFTTYMETYTAEMHKFMIKQIKLLIVQNKWLNILKLLAQKAILETSE